MYESPVKISFDKEISKVTQEADNQIIATIQQLVSVDKDELIRALQYDRGQYEKGYEDGKMDAVKHGEWIKRERGGMFCCSECNFVKPYDLYDTSDNVVYWECDYCRNCGAKMDGKENEDD